MMRFSLVALGALLSTGFAPQARTAAGSEYPSRLVREEQRVSNGGISEVWQLRWTAQPKAVCEPSDVSLTCPCTGFAYGEGGNLELVRLRGQVEVESLRLAPLFDEQFAGKGKMAIVPLRPVDRRADSTASLRDDFAALVATRPMVQVMNFADYDHDGAGSEFYLQTGTAPCGKNVGVVIGVSKVNPRLHVFGSVSHPEKALYLQKREWEALRDASGAIDVADWTCGDHGAELETRLRLRWTREGIDGSRREFTCPPAPRKMVREGPL